jgi:hypothetical protein
MKRCISIMLLLGILCSLQALARVQAGGGDPYLKFNYGGDMNFGVSVLKDPAGKAVNKLLTYSSSGSTNNSLVRIEGKDQPLTGKWTVRDKKDGNASTSVWADQGIEISQILEVRPGKEGRLDTLLIRYVIENKSGQGRNVGLRVMIDSLIGGNDGVPFRYAGANELVTTMKDFTGGAVPAWVEALENADLNNPGTIAHLTCKVGGSVEPPGRVSITDWRSASAAGNVWDLPMKSFKDSHDSCLVLYWNEGQLAAGARREVGYAYGTASAPSPTTPAGPGGGSCPMTFARDSWGSTPWGPITIKVDGNHATANYKSRNGNAGAWDGTVTGNVLQATWKDPQASGKIKITLANDGCSWAGTYTTDGAGGGPSTGTSGMDPGRCGGTPAGDPWNTPQGQACFEKWIQDAMGKLNAYKSPNQDFNLRKPWSINKYGVLEGGGGKGPTSVAAPDNFRDYKFNRYWWMWDNYVQDANGRWNDANWNNAGVPSLRDYVMRCVGSSSTMPCGGGSGPGGADGMILQANDYRVLPGQEVLVPIYLIRAKDVKNMNWTLTYDSGIAALIDPKVVQGNMPISLFEANPTQDGYVRMGLAQNDTLNDTGTVAVLRFKAVGPPGSKTPLTLAASEVNNPQRQSLPITLINGSIEIVKDSGQLTPGSCYGGTKLTAADARCALQMSVGNRPVSLQMDVNNDGQVTSQDAAIILQTVADQARLGQ